MANYGLGNSNAVEDVFAEPISNTSSLNSLEKRIEEFNQTQRSPYAFDNSVSQIKIKDVRSYIFECEKIIYNLLSEVETNLESVNINPYVNSKIDSAHTAVWKDVEKHNKKTQFDSEEGTFTIQVENPKPSFICYQEYIFAASHQCRACREFIKQYELVISQTSFGHLYAIKKMLEHLYDEIMLIKNISVNYFGETYNNETESEIAKHLTDWAKTVTHYTKQFAKEITTLPVSLPQSELDQVSAKQAAQFQAFFSIKINSIASEINSLIHLVKRDSSDTSQMFYNNFLLPVLTFKSKLLPPLMLDMSTTSMSLQLPTLTGELVVANNAIVGNLGSITADLVERRITLGKRLSAFVENINLKRRYINYLIQMESIGKLRQPFLTDPSSDDVKKYVEAFSSIVVDSSKRESLRSSHDDLDDIDGDAHPQYLRIDGGTIYGPITFAEGATIAGMDLANHTHNMTDGSYAINANSIDYESAREEYYRFEDNKPYSNLVVTGFNAVSKIGGGYDFDVSFDIEIEDDKINSYDFEILYKEI